MDIYICVQLQTQMLYSSQVHGTHVLVLHLLVLVLHLFSYIQSLRCHVWLVARVHTGMHG